ncbi:MAG: ATP-dependent DNA helicase RecG [Chloroflexi bacterium RBG_16_56_11]|nr:MAG: ATP-dependent DNA helicase RecG [Chloroflexi bacterium RBG_16_56_11]
MLMDAVSLRKILDLEKRRGYGDTAVIGGLDRFLAGWVSQAAGLISKRSLLARFRKLFDVSYAAMPGEKRRDWLESAISLLDEIEAKNGNVPGQAVLPAPGKPPRKRVNRPVPPAGDSLDAPVTAVRGISTVLATKFGRLGVKTVRDLLYFFPRRHLDYSHLKFISQLTEGEEQTIVANVWQARETRPGGRRSAEAIVGDETGNIRAIWFNQPYLVKTLATNSRVMLSGRVSLFRGQHVFQSPDWELVEGQDLVHTARLVPVYPLTQGLRPRQVRRLMKDFIDTWAGRLADFLPGDLRQRLDLLELPAAIRQAHYPENETARDRARVRLAFDELFLLQLGVMGRKRAWQETRPGSPFAINRPLPRRFLDSLPFSLTASQEKVVREIMADLALSRPMSRLLQGEVGSGKTVVATAALLAAVASGFQAAFMAPTEILAEQHFATICQLLAKMGEVSGEGNLRSFTGLTELSLQVALLIGDIRQAGKKQLQKAISEGEVDIVIGTHALVQKDVGFSRLGLVVVDEQHRFGVEQRGALREKGFNPHMLVMTATPIPRTLALTLYGDLDLSVITELPPGRQAVKTKWLRPDQRQSAYAFVRKQVKAGRQAFVLCPLIEESDAVVAQAAVAEYERLSREVFPDLRLGILHGRLSSRDKDGAMAKFRAGELDILVSTPVIEVGIDIPNATVMLIESADRFGLSQLHQFRGRVGRGKEQSYCMLLAENPSEIGRQRLDIIENVQDGFKLAEEDLKMRGPGEFFGTRQSGLPDLRMARISDVAILELARREAIKLFESDPGLRKAEHRPLAAEMARVWTGAGEWS